MRLILHIGQYKTGSSSIQRSFARADEAMRDRRILYPLTGRQGDAHGGLAEGLRREARGGPAFDATPLLAEVGASGCDTVILSCEGFSGARLEAMEAGITATVLHRLGAIFAGWDTQVVYYWRRQDEAVESRIVQAIKGRGAATEVDPAPYLAPEQALDVGFFHATVAAALPQATIHPRCFAPSLLEGGEVVADFLAVTGLTGTLTPEQIKRTNITPSGRQLALQLAVNRLTAAGQDTTALKAALNRPPQAQGPKAVLLEPEQRQKIMEYFGDANERALAAVVAPEQRDAVAAYLDSPVSQARPNITAGADDLVALMTRSDAPATPPGETVRIYLGAHKTASTHLQDMMVFHRATLATHGTTVSHPGFLRGRDGWLATFYDAVESRERSGRVDPDLSDRLRAPLVAGHDWLVSDENILGTAKEVLGEGSLYAWAAPRFPVLAEVFDDRRVEVFMALRSYDSFFPAMYSEVLRNDRYLPFEEFRAGIDAVQPPWSWLPTVEALVEGFGEEALTLWDFADFTALQPQIVTLLSGVADGQGLIDTFPRRSTRASLSDRSIALIGDLAAAIGPEATLKLTEQINECYGVGAGFARFQPYDAAEVAAMRQRYRDDLATIRSRWPGIGFLTPED